MAVSFSRNQIVYLKGEGTYGQAPAFGASDACRFARFDLNRNREEVPDPDKTGSLGEGSVEPGRNSAGFSAEFAVRPNGLPGELPDAHEIFTAAFNSLPVVTASTSVVWSIAETGNARSFSALNVRPPTTVMQQIGAGLLVQSITFNLGQNAALIQCNGAGKNVVDSETFSVLDTEGRCGLSSFPTPPSSPVYTGKHQVGFVGSFLIDGVALNNIVSGSVTFQTGFSPDNQEFNSYYPKSPSANVRTVRLSFTLNDADDAATKALYQKAQSQVLVPVVLTIGTVAGRRMRLNLAGAQLSFPRLEDGAEKWRASFSDNKVSGTGNASLDALTLTFD